MALVGSLLGCRADMLGEEWAKEEETNLGMARCLHVVAYFVRLARRQTENRTGLFNLFGKQETKHFRKHFRKQFSVEK